MTPEQRERLPKWAQREFSALEADLKSAKEKLRQMDEDDTNVHMSAYPKDIALPRDSRITFHVEDETFAVRVDNYGGKEYLNIYAYDGVVAVSPVASNVVQISAVDW